MKKLIEVSAEENAMENQFSRTERLLGKENMEKLAAARVCIFGIGGVGGYVVEALAECKGITTEEVERITKENAERLFWNS